MKRNILSGLVILGLIIIVGLSIIAVLNIGQSVKIRESSKDIKLVFKKKLEKPLKKFGDTYYFSEGGKYIGITMNGNFYLLDKASGKEKWQYFCGYKGEGQLSPDGKKVLIAGFDRQKMEGRVILLSEFKEILWKKNLPGIVHGSFSVESGLIGIKSGIESDIDLWIFNEKGEACLDDKASINKNESSNVWLLPNGNLLVYENGIDEKLKNINILLLDGHYKKAIKIYNVDKKKEIFELNTQFQPIYSKIQPTQFILHFYDSKNSRINLYGFKMNGQLLWKKSWLWQGAYPLPISLSDNGNRLAINDWTNDLLLVFDSLIGEKIWDYSLKKSLSADVDISSNGEWTLLLHRDAPLEFNRSEIAHADQKNNIFIFNNKGQIIYQDKLGKNIVQASFSHDGRYLYMADENTFYAYDVSGLFK